MVGFFWKIYGDFMGVDGVLMKVKFVGKKYGDFPWDSNRNQPFELIKLDLC
jgi:hypothetical protein